MYIPEKLKGARELVPGQSFDLALPIGRPGRVTLIASARRRSLTLATPAQYRVELYAPGGVHPVAAQDIEGLGLLAILEHEAKGPAGLWTARITNCNSHPLQVSLEASYPGLGDLAQRNLPSHLLEAIASKLLAETTVHLRHGNNACAVCFSPDLNLRDFRFTVPAIDRRVCPPLLPDIRILQQVHDINSNSVRLRLLPGSVANPGGTLRMEIGFEDDGIELTGSFPIHLARMKLLVELDLGITDNRIAYNNVRASFDFDIDIQPLPVWMYNPLFDFRDRLQESVCAGVRAAFTDLDTCESVAIGVERGLEVVLGPNARAATVQMEYGQVSLGLFRVAQSAVA